MMKTLFAITSIAAAVTAAAAVAETKEQSNSGINTTVSIEAAGHTDCRSQVWPNIDSRCLGTVSAGLTVRSARVVEM